MLNGPRLDISYLDKLRYVCRSSFRQGRDGGGGKQPFTRSITALCGLLAPNGQGVSHTLGFLTETTAGFCYLFNSGVLCIHPFAGKQSRAILSVPPQSIFTLQFMP